MPTTPKSNKAVRGRSGRGRGRGVSKSTAAAKTTKPLNETIEVSSSDDDSDDRVSGLLPKPVFKRARRLVTAEIIKEEGSTETKLTHVSDMETSDKEHQDVHMSKGKKRASSDDDKSATEIKQVPKLRFAEGDDEISVTSEISGDDSKMDRDALKGNIVYYDAATSDLPPKTDESDVGTRDPALKATYKGLVNIRAAIMHSWSDRPGNGQPSYTGILRTIAKINTPLVIDAIIFQKHRNYANLSRIDPALVSTGQNGQTFLHLCGSSKALVFTSVILVDESHILEGKSNPNTKPIKFISGALIEGEWERFVGAIGMVIHEHDFKAQIFKDNLSFSTTPFNDESPVASPSKSGRLFSGQISPFSRRATSSNNKIALNFNDKVPLYDARRVQNSFIETLDNLESLPPFKREIPFGSCVVTGYTVHTFKRKQDQIQSLSFNVQWAMLMGKL